MPITPQPHPTIERLLAVSVALGAAITAAVILVPGLRFAYRSVPVHVALETAAALIAALAAVLIAWRVTRSRRSSEALLVGAFALLAAVDLYRAFVPHLLDGADADVVSWAGVLGSLFGLSLFVAAAVLPSRRMASPRRGLQGALVLAAALAVGAAVLAVGFAPALPPVIVERLAPELSFRPQLGGSPTVLALQVTLGLMLAVAALALLRSLRRTGDELRGWLAVAAAFAAVSRLNFALFPSLDAGLVYTGDVFRLAFYVAVLVGALREIAAYQPRLAAAAVFEERRRVARDLHDGLAQELAFMTAQLATLRDRGDERREIVELERASRRALDESRLAVTALSRPADEALGTAAEALARSIAARGGVDVTVDAEAAVEVDPETRDTVLRILAEAVSNAVRHARASCIAVRLTVRSDLELSVVDDGDGFDPDRPTGPGRYGLQGMRERAEAVGGRLRLRSAPGAGTVVEAVLPLLR